MNMENIFKPILDLKSKILYRDSATDIRVRIAEYNAALRKNVSPKLFVRYCISQCDIYVDMTMITVATRNVYPDVAVKAVRSWILKYKEPHHFLTA